jgi:pyridoxamine 5'-phosphate oxidase
MLAKGLLPTRLPDDPMPLLEEWFTAARKQQVQPNPDSMVVATATPDGSPSARVVLCKRFVASPGYIVFFTNYDSRKGADLAINPRAAAVFHWDALGRQARLEGPIVKSPAAESDEYFSSRALESRLGAWASLQSQPLESRTLLLKRVAVETARFGTKVPRPPHWGGYRLWPEKLELWIDGPFRVHDRALWTRTLAPGSDADFSAAPWQSTRLFP